MLLLLLLLLLLVLLLLFSHRVRDYRSFSSLEATLALLQLSHALGSVPAEHRSQIAYC